MTYLHIFKFIMFFVVEEDKNKCLLFGKSELNLNLNENFRKINCLDACHRSLTQFFLVLIILQSFSILNEQKLL